MIQIRSGSLLHQAYGQDYVAEQFACNYGLNPKFHHRFEKDPFNVVGTDLDGEVRAIELSNHPFFIGTLYLPQVSSGPDKPHPLIVAYLEATKNFRLSRIIPQ